MNTPSFSHTLAALNAIAATQKAEAEGLELDIKTRLLKKRVLPQAIETVRQSGFMAGTSPENLDAWRRRSSRPTFWPCS